MSKALIISVGTGIGQESTIAHGIVSSIQTHNPDKVFYVVSEESETKTLPKVLEQCRSIPYEIWQLSAIDDVNKSFVELRDRFRRVRQEFDNVTVDYTSGTKTMSALVAILGSLFEVDALSYVSGERLSNIVQRGSESVISLSPYTIIAEKEFAKAIALFNRCQYSACLSILDGMGQKANWSLLTQLFSDSIENFRNLALAYQAWDKFCHEEARSVLSNVKIPQVDGNKEFLGKLTNAKEKAPYLMADLLNNAKRRGDVEKKYDDAVARLYRVTEMLAQWKLRVDYKIPDTGNVPREQLQSGYPVVPSPDGKIKLALFNSYQLLDKFDDPLGKEFVQDRTFLSLLEARNKSIFAHGDKPVEEETYSKFCTKVRELVTRTLQQKGLDFDRLLSISHFITWSPL